MLPFLTTYTLSKILGIRWITCPCVSVQPGALCSGIASICKESPFKTFSYSPREPLKTKKHGKLPIKLVTWCLLASVARHGHERANKTYAYWTRKPFRFDAHLFAHYIHLESEIYFVSLCAWWSHAGGRLEFTRVKTNQCIHGSKWVWSTPRHNFWMAPEKR